MDKTSLVITTIGNQDHPILREFAHQAKEHNVSMIIIGDAKSPDNFSLANSEFYSIKDQLALNLRLPHLLPFNHYSRKNIGYLVAMSNGAEKIIETDDDNSPYDSFWDERNSEINTFHLSNHGWVNIYKYFTEENIWPRGFPLEHIKTERPQLREMSEIYCPIQQGLADNNPDVDAIYRLTSPLPIKFKDSSSIALGRNAMCPFNSQNTTWFKDAFALLYLPSFCSFRMTDIWRSFVAQRIAWTCNWHILFHQSTVQQERNDHNLMLDFKDELIGYNNNSEIFEQLNQLQLKEGSANIHRNMITCYEKLIDLGYIDGKELDLLDAWFRDIQSLI